MRVRASIRKWYPHFGHTLRFRSRSREYTISLHPSHLTQRPSGTVLRGRSMRTGLGVFALRNQAMERDGGAGSPGAAPSVRSDFGGAPLFGLEVVRDPETHAGGVVHLARGLLGVLELGQTVLDLGELLLDQAVELVHLLPGHGERILVELSLLVAEAHRLPSIIS